MQIRDRQVEQVLPAVPRVAETPAALLRRLRWTVLRPLATMLGGDERSLLLGPGMELDELRLYTPGDDVRHIDWNLTARTGQPFIRQARVERALDAWIAFDVSASLHWGTARCLKRDLTVDLAALASMALMRHGNRVGALLFAERPLGMLPPASGRAALLRLVERLQIPPSHTYAAPTALTAALQRIELIARRRAIVLVISDFLAPDGWQTPLGRLARRHDVIAVRVVDPREHELPDIGIITLQDPESGAQLVVDTSSRVLRERFAAAARLQDTRIREELGRHGIGELLLRTDETLLPPLTRFLQARRRQRSAPNAQHASARASARTLQTRIGTRGETDDL
jgi:uncharacterized protein (DUF58 family)